MSKPGKISRRIPKKIFLIDATVVDGEHEHSSHALVRARDETELQALIDKIFRHDDSGLDHEKAYFGHGDGLTRSKCAGAKEISAADADTLVRLNVVHFY